MANIKISELNELSTGADNDYLPIVDSSESETKKIKKENLLIEEYSINETKTNKIWTDGKPIYRKVIVLNSFSLGETEIQHLISDINEIIDIRAVGYRSGGDFEPIPTMVPPSSQSLYQISVYDINDTRFRLYLGERMQTGTLTLEKLSIIFEYTKTTN